ncbi:hypothetical protein H5410_030052 [Solanum commersonii]|uniref:Uncharacterized protein n=1 Tax=Solanum commersonii TaxID=4109 RepID=A0A9J5YEN2_SOLCO|nr:hypothetical protein H5410_030052 [Solanum commersonii]
MIQIREVVEHLNEWKPKQGNSSFWFENWMRLGTLYFIVPEGLIEEEAEKLKDGLPEDIVQHITERIKTPLGEDGNDIAYWSIENQATLLFDSSIDQESRAECRTQASKLAISSVFLKCIWDGRKQSKNRTGSLICLPPCTALSRGHVELLFAVEMVHASRRGGARTWVDLELTLENGVLRTAANVEELGRDYLEWELYVGNYWNLKKKWVGWDICIWAEQWFVELEIWVDGSLVRKEFGWKSGPTFVQDRGNKGRINIVGF